MGAPLIRNKLRTGLEVLVVFFWSTTTSRACDTPAFARAIASGDLSKARALAVELLLGDCCDEHVLAQIYQDLANDILQRNETLVLQKAHSITATTNHHHRTIQLLPPPDAGDCWNWRTGVDTFQPPWEIWDRCCSMLQMSDDNTIREVNGGLGTSQSMLSTNLQNDECCYDLETGARFCCEFRAGSSSYLRLPALREMALRVRVPTEDIMTTYVLQQDGFLRRFDSATVLWPAGYLLGLCVAAPQQCGVPEIYHTTGSVLELGAGIGFPSIALARSLQAKLSSRKIVIVATDQAPQARALTAANAHAAQAAAVTTAPLDHMNTTAMENFRSREYPTGFSIVMGAALPGLVDDESAGNNKDHHLWHMLDLLLADEKESIVLLAHTIHSLQVPNHAKFVRIRTISGDVFNMTTRLGASSDFEISVLRRAVPSDSPDQSVSEEQEL